MPSFEITDCPTTLELKPPVGAAGVQGTLSLTIRNATDHRRTARVTVKPDATSEAGWFTLNGAPGLTNEHEIDFEPGATQTAQVTVSVPGGTTGGKHLLHVRVVAENDPDTDFVESGAVAFIVPPPPPPVVAPSKPFPWWIVAVGTVAVIAVGVVIYLVSHQGSRPPQPLPQAQPQIAGEWSNTDPNTSNVTRILIRDNKLHVWGKCHPQDCDWGETALQAVNGSANDFTATYDQGFAERRLTLRFTPPAAVEMTTDSHYKDNSGRQDRRNVDRFGRR